MAAVPGAAVGQSSAANRAVRRRQLGVRRPRPARRLRERTGRDVAAYGTTDIVANPRQYLAPERPTLLVSFARSGNSPESVATVELADQLLPESYHLMLVCNPDSKLAQYAHRRDNVCSLVMPQGSNDQSFAMTSSFSCMMLSAALLLGPLSLEAARCR